MRGRMTGAGKLKGRRALFAAAVPVLVACLVVLAVLPATSAAPTRGNGYWLAAASGSVFAFGDASVYAGAAGTSANGIVGMAARATGKGYWLAAGDGSVYPFGDAPSLGEADKKSFKGKIAAIAATPSTEGYWLAGAKGEILAFGDARVLGDPEERSLKGGAVVDIAATPSGRGYLLLTSAGEVLAFGDASSFGSADAKKGRSMALALLPTGDGYWIVNDKGDVVAFGAATAYGSGQKANGPVVDIAGTVTGRGYWLVGADGQVTAFGDAVLYGGLGRPELKGAPIVAIVTTPFVNHPPVTAPDLVTLDEDTSVDIDVLANDIDIDGDTFRATIATQPANGVATQGPDGTIRYRPNPNYNGSDSFTYLATDSLGASSTGTVTLTILPVNDAPTGAPQTYTTAEDTPLTVSAPGLLQGASDPDADPLTALVISSTARGLLQVAADGSFTYLPEHDFFGTDTFSFQVSDGALMSDIVLVTITVSPVNDPPLAVADAYTVAVGSSLTVPAPGVLANDVDDAAGLTAVLVTGVASGTLTLDPLGSFTYVTNLTVAGVDSFTYQASDGTELSAAVTVTITVTASSSGGGGAGSFGGFATARQAVLDIDSLALNGGPVGEQPKHGKIITRSGVQYYVPQAGYRGADTFVVGGRRYNVDVLSAMQGDY